MKTYECVVIYAPTVGTDVLESSTKKYTEVITSRGGKFSGVDDWGKRSLAYEIAFHREGFYHFYKFDGDGEIINELNRQMRIDENVIRHMIVRDEPKPDVTAPRPEGAGAPSQTTEEDRR